MVESLKHFDCNRIWVLDRCTDNSEELLKELGEFYIKTPDNLLMHLVKNFQNLWHLKMGLSQIYQMNLPQMILCKLICKKGILPDNCR